jgi:hypothetical protein
MMSRPARLPPTWFPCWRMELFDNT